MQTDPDIRRAEKLRAIISMPEYGATIGNWLTEAHASALHEMTTATEPHEFHSAQGAYRLIQSIQEQFERVFIAEKAAVEKTQKKIRKTEKE